MRVLAGFILVAAVSLSLQGVAASCVAVQEIDDPAGDQIVPGGAPAADSAPADILHLRMERLESGVALSLKLAADPRASAVGQGPATFSYWIGFADGGNSGAGNVPTWTFQGSTTYDQITTMYWSNAPRYLPVAWNGTTLSFIVPWSAFASQYGNNTPEFGSPTAQSSGPSVAGANNPSEDFVTYSRDFEPLPDCGSAPESVTTESSNSTPATESNRTSGASSGSAKAPLFSLFGAIFVVLVVAARRRR